jgi:hypothetical protein
MFVSWFHYYTAVPDIPSIDESAGELYSKGSWKGGTLCVQIMLNVSFTAAILALSNLIDFCQTKQQELLTHRFIF